MVFDAIRKHTKIVIIIVVIAFGIGGAFMGLGGLFSGSSPTMYQGSESRVMAVATVDGDPLYYQDLYYILYSYQQQFPQQIRGMELLPFKHRILEAMIEETIINQEATRRNIIVAVDPEEVEERLNVIISQYASSQEEFEEMLKRSNYTLSQLREELTQELKRENTFKALVDDVTEAFPVQDEDLLSQLEEIRASHILIEKEGNGEGLEKVLDIRTRILEGEDFNELAKEYSICPSSGEGGDLGFFKRGSMVLAFEEVAFSLSKGELSDIVETEFGYHIIRLEERKDFNSLEEEEREEILAELRQDKKDMAFQEWMDSMKSVRKITINDPAIRGYSFLVKDDTKQAISDYQEALEYDPDNAYLYAHLGNLFIQLDEKEKALEAYTEAAELAPYDMQILFTLGSIYQDKGDYEEALSVFDEIREWAGSDLMLHYQLLEAYEKLGNKERVEDQKELIEDLQEKQMAEFRKMLEEMERERAKEEAQDLIMDEEILPEIEVEEGGRP